ncbi:MAG: membrane dipeptidase [Promethearchaeota archaeon]
MATPSNARSVCNHLRNLTDEQIKAIHEKYGTIGINFYIKFLDPEHPGEEYINLGLDAIKKHRDHVIDLTDINTVANGSDFDGTSVTKCVRNCTKYPNLWNYLLENGYSSQDFEKISHENLLRVFKKTSI